MWLERFIGNCVGREIRVKAVLALPGWYVAPGSHDGEVLVINPSNSQRFFRNRPVCLDNQMIKQAVFQIEQRCRTITPFDPY